MDINHVEQTVGKDLLLIFRLDFKLITLRNVKRKWDGWKNRSHGCCHNHVAPLNLRLLMMEGAYALFLEFKGSNAPIYILKGIC